ncbi:transcriptional regulator [Flavobacterium sp.]|uniref:transcriptional regulator n=1 Tax=Flavobacterium sp. TaxID=239 RepID=UPI00286E11AF|nr:transcriptional regulator [Flavobacterium sp.]
MRELNEKGYVKYEPSFNPYKGSMVILFDFSEYLKPVQKKASTSEKILPNIEQALNKQQTGSDTSTSTSTEQALVSSINNTNITNKTNILKDLNLDEQTQNFEDENVIARNEAISEKNEEEKKLREKKKGNIVASSASSRAQSKDEKPTNDEVKSYFLQQNLPELEANKFFNYFSSVGWLVGGKIPMVDWQAAAQNWMLNANKFNPNEILPDRAKHLNIGNDKDYSEPL